MSAEQAKIYLFLLTSGLSPAKQIATKTAIGRALTYKILDQLITLNLVEERGDIGKITIFSPKHPRNLKDMVEKKQKAINHAFSDLNTIFGSLSSEFNALLGKPNVQFYEGEQGLQEIYDDILDTAETIQIISSPMGKEFFEKSGIGIRKQIEKQASKYIKTRAITPLQVELDEQGKNEDKAHLIDRKVIKAEKFNIPAQIIIYNDKVAITNFKETVVTVIMESKYIAETFKTMFEYIWNKN